MILSRNLPKMFTFNDIEQKSSFFFCSCLYFSALGLVLRCAIHLGPLRNQL